MVPINITPSHFWISWETNPYKYTTYAFTEQPVVHKYSEHTSVVVLCDFIEGTMSGKLLKIALQFAWDGQYILQTRDRQSVYSLSTVAEQTI